MSLDGAPEPIGGRSPAQVTAGSLVFGTARLLAVPLAALAIAIVARAVGVESFGHLSLAFSLVAALNNLGDFGFGQVVVRELAASRADEPGLAAGFLVARTTASFLLLGGALAFVGWSVPSRAFPAVALIVATLPALAVANLTVVAQARFRPHWQGLLALGQAATWLGLVAALTAMDASLAWYGAAFLLASLVHAAGATATARRLVSLDFRSAGRRAKRLLAESWPLGLTGLFITAYYHLDQVLLYNIAGPEPAGLYGAAYRYLDVAQILPATLLAAALPVLSRLRSRESVSFARVAQLSLALAVAVCAPVAVVGVFLSDEIIRTLYGSNFRDGGRLLAILAPSVVAISASYLTSALLIVARRQSLLGWVAAPAAAGNIALNVLLIPTYGAKGAAWITLATEVAVCLATLVVMVKVTGLRLPVARLFGCVVAAASMVIAAALLEGAGVNDAVAVAASGVVYGAVILGSRAVTVSDVRSLLDRRELLDSE